MTTVISTTTILVVLLHKVNMARFLSISNLIASLLDAGTKEAMTYSAPAQESGGVTLRFESELLHFLDSQAQSLGCTRSAVVAMILTGVMRQSKGDLAGGTLVQNANSTVDRVQLLLQMHGLDVVSAVELLAPFGVTMAVMADRNELANRIGTAQALDFLDHTFFVGRKWLQGETDSPSGKIGEWYRQVYAFCYHVAQLASAGLSPEVIFLRPQGADFALAYADTEDRQNRQYVMPIVRITRTLPSGRRFEVFEQWSTERWNYANCRRYLKLMMLWSLRAKSPLGVRNRGIDLHPDAFKALDKGQILPIQAMSRSGNFGPAWYIDDYVTKWEHGKEQDELPLLEELYEEKLAKDFDHLNWQLPEHIKQQTYQFKIPNVTR